MQGSTPSLVPILPSAFPFEPTVSHRVAGCTSLVLTPNLQPPFPSPRHRLAILSTARISSYTLATEHPHVRATGGDSSIGLIFAFSTLPLPEFHPSYKVKGLVIGQSAEVRLSHFKNISHTGSVRSYSPRRLKATRLSRRPPTPPTELYRRHSSVTNSRLQ